MSKKIFPHVNLPAFTSLGSYPLVYLVCSEGKYSGFREEVMCSRCAASVSQRGETRDGKLVSVEPFIHHEGSPIECEATDFDQVSDCWESIESAYGDPEREEAYEH